MQRREPNPTGEHSQDFRLKDAGKRRLAVNALPQDCLFAGLGHAQRESSAATETGSADATLRFERLGDCHEIDENPKTSPTLSAAERPK